MNNEDYIPIYLESLKINIGVRLSSDPFNQKIEILHDGRYSDEIIQKAFDQYVEINFNNIINEINYNVNMEDESTIKEDIRKLYAGNNFKEFNT